MLFNARLRVQTYHFLNIQSYFDWNTGVAWLSSVRIVRSEVNSTNGRNPCR